MAEIIALCGAGGKTSYIWKLRDHYVSLGKKVAIVTTTHMYKEAFTDTTCDSRKMIENMNQKGWVMAGTTDPEHPEKIIALPPEEYDALCSHADYVLVEADGSKHRSVKCPNDTEPVLPEAVTKIIIIMGLWDIGEPISEVLHRYEEYKKHFSKDAEEMLTYEDIEAIVEKCYIDRIKEKHPNAALEVFYSEKAEEGIIFRNRKDMNNGKKYDYLKKQIIVRGGGDLATAVIHRLTKAGFPVLVLETKYPAAIRRQVSFCEAIYEGSVTIEGIEAVSIRNAEDRFHVWEQGKVPVLIDPDGTCIPEVKPFCVVDAIIAKKNLGTKLSMAPVTIGIGPGFEAGVDVHYVIESMRGHNLGRIFTTGCAMADTKIPGDIGGYTKERVIHAPSEGIISTISRIGDMVEAGQTIAVIDKNGEEIPVHATIPGLLRGLIRDGYPVSEGFKIADIDPRKEQLKNCFTISDKARCIAGSVLEIVCMEQQ